jgi:hypothetical protein
MAKADIRICPYCNCPFPDHELNIKTDPFVKSKSNRYYHKQCFEEEQKVKARTDDEKADIALLIDMWKKNISNTVNYGYLRKVINEYVQRGVSTDYLVFCLQYVIANRMSLNYPNGFKYYVDKKEIKDAYDKKQMQKQFDALQKELKERHSESPIGSSNAPSFAMKKQKDEGFGSILK